ncbi:MAG: hypothetical protein PUB48_04105, partial [Solobacterium sp.]|nr:hypothetical protein [Solobacterium sp.]
LGNNISTDIKVDFYYGYEKLDEKSNVISKKVDTTSISDISVTENLSEMQNRLTNMGISYNVKEGNASILNSGKVEKVSITANGNTKELTPGQNWTANFTSASATIYTYKEPTLSVSVLTNNEGKITRFTAVYNGIDDVTYIWYDGDREIGSGKDYSVEGTEMNSIKLVVKAGDKSMVATYPAS